MVSLLGLVGAQSAVGYEAPLGDTGEGPAWADPVEVTGCRINRGVRRARGGAGGRQVQTAAGQVVTITATVLMPAVPEPVPGGRVDLRDGRGPRLVHTVDTPVWLDGSAMHHEVGLA